MVVLHKGQMTSGGGRQRSGFRGADRTDARYQDSPDRRTSGRLRGRSLAAFFAPSNLPLALDSGWPWRLSFPQLAKASSEASKSRVR
jgi:hypothetical protein